VEVEGEEASFSYIYTEFNSPLSSGKKGVLPHLLWINCKARKSPAPMPEPHGKVTPTCKQINMEKAPLRIVSLSDLLALETGRIMEGEKYLIGLLPGWIQGASSTRLKSILTQYLEYIRHHEQQMVNYFMHQPPIPSEGRNRVMRALVEEATEKLGYCADAEIYDACLLASVQEINHYKISVYGTVTAFFNALDQSASAAIFHKAEKDEKRIDEQLSFQADLDINELARMPGIQ
jgi:ferritin-like metal-binding protein YciE